MSLGRDRARQPGGSPVGGQFAPTSGHRADVSLASGAVSGSDHFPPALVAAFEAAERATAEQLWEFVRHHDPLVRAEAATNPNLTDEQVEDLAEDGEWIVRWTLVQRSDLDAWRSMVDDHDPRVRLAVAGQAHPGTRDRLLADPTVSGIAEQIFG